jgi:uncharacterized paraquat-inducible protein A
MDFRLALEKLQSVMHAAARLMYNKRKFDHVTPILHELHWLSMLQRTLLKVAALTFRCLHNLAPPHITECLPCVSDLPSRRRLRLSSIAGSVVPSIIVYLPSAIEHSLSPPKNLEQSTGIRNIGSFVAGVKSTPKD